MHIDPIFIIASAIAIAVLLASAATHKVRAPARSPGNWRITNCCPRRWCVRAHAWCR